MLAERISVVQFTFSARDNQEYSTPQQLCHRILSHVDTVTGKAMEGFYTPAELTDLMTQLVKPTPEEAFLDPVCGSGGFLLSAMDYTASRSNASQKLIGFEQNVFARSLTQMSLFLCGARNGEVFQGGYSQRRLFHQILKREVLMLSSPIRHFHSSYLLKLKKN